MKRTYPNGRRPSERLAALRAMREGESSRQYSLRTGITEQTLSAWARSAGIQRQQPRRVGETIRDRAVDDVRSGASYFHAAEMHGVHVTTVRYWCRIAGVTSRHQRGVRERRPRARAVA